MGISRHARRLRGLAVVVAAAAATCATPRPRLATQPLEWTEGVSPFELDLAATPSAAYAPIVEAGALVIPAPGLAGTDQVTLETLTEQARGTVLAFEVAGKLQLGLFVEETIRLRAGSRQIDTGVSLPPAPTYLALSIDTRRGTALLGLDGKIVWRGDLRATPFPRRGVWSVNLTAGFLRAFVLRDTALPASELLGRQLVREAYRQPRRPRSPRAQPQAVPLSTVLDLAMSPDEKRVAAVGRPAAVTIWDYESGMLLHRLTGHLKNVQTVAFSPDGRLLATAGNDPFAIIWEVESGAQKHRLEIGAITYTMEFAPDGKQLVIGSEDGVVRIWDVATGTERRRFDDGAEFVRRIAFDDTGRKLVIAGKYRVRMIDFETGEEEWRRRLTPNSSDTAGDLAIDPRGRWLAMIYDHAVELADLATGKTVSKSFAAHERSPETVAFDQSGQRLLTASRGGDINVWELPSGRRLSKMAKRERAVRTGVAQDDIHVATFVAGGTTIVSGGKIYDSRDATSAIEIWSVAESRVVRQIRSPTRHHERTLSELVTMMRGSLDRVSSSAGRGNAVLVARGTQPVTLWDLEALRPRRLMAGAPLPEGTVELSEDQQRAYYLGGHYEVDTILRVWDTATGEVVVDRKSDRHIVDGVIFPAAGFAVAATQAKSFAAGRLEIWPLDEAGEVEILPELKHELYALATDAAGRRAITVSGDPADQLASEIVFWDLGARQATRRVPGLPVTCAALSPDGAQFALAIRGSRVVVGREATGLQSVIEIPAEVPIRGMLFLSSTRLLLGDDQGRVFAVDLATPTRRHLLLQLTEPVVQLSLRDGFFIATGAELTVRVSRGLEGPGVTLLSHDQEWLVTDDQGYFDGTAGAMPLMAIVVDGHARRVDQFAVERNRPDLLLDHLEVGDPARRDYYRARYEYRVGKSRRADGREVVTPPPTVRSVALEAAPRSVELRATLSAAAGLASYQLFVNDVALFDGRGRPIEGARAVVEETIELIPGVNKIEVSCFDRRGRESIRAVTTAIGEAVGLVRRSGQSTKVVELALIGPDLLATALVEGLVELRQLGSGGLVRRLGHRYDGYDYRTRAMAAQPGGRFLAASFRDNRVRVWDHRTGLTHTVFTRSGSVTHLAFVGARLFGAGVDGTVQVWDVEEATGLGQLADPRGRVSALAAAPGRGLVAVGADDQVRIFDASSLALVATLAVDAHALDFHPDRPLIAAIGGDGRVEIFDFERNRRVSGFAGSPARGGGIRWSPDGTQLAVVGCVEQVEDRSYCESATLRLFTTGGDLIAGWQDEATNVGPLAFAPDGRTIVASWDSEVVEWTPQEYLQSRADLYVVGFGVSRYADPAIPDLGFAHQDAIDLTDLFRRADAGFRRVVVERFTDEQVTRARIRAVKAELLKTRPQDVVVVFIAGHGVHDRDPSSTYYYVTADARLSALAKTAASFAELEELIAGIPARRKLVLLDTCESGEVIDLEPEYRVAVGAESHRLGARNLVVKSDTQEPTEAGARPAPRTRASWIAEHDRLINQDVFRRTGAIVLSSSKGSEVSLEDPRLANGVFTEAIVEALTGDAADVDRDGWVTTDELRAYVIGRVPQLTADAQHPTVDRDNLFQRFRFPIVEKEAR